MIGQFATRLVCGSILGIWAAAGFCRPVNAADDPQEDAAQAAIREQSLVNMKRSAAQYTLSSADAPQRAFKFEDVAAMRFDNPISGTKDGAIFVWTHHGRP